MSAAVGCCVRVTQDRSGWTTFHAQCARRGKVERNGKWYCAQHDPQAKEARREKQREQWAIDNAESARKRRMADAAPALLAALEEVRALISEAAATGFNCKDGDWPERLFFSQQKTSAVIARSKGETL